MAQRNFQPKHRKAAGKTFNGRKDIEDMYRRTDDWRNYCARFLKINPECYACGEPATVVDHLKPHKGDEHLFKKTDNHIPLCVSCHNTVTAKFDAKYIPGNPITEKIKWLSRKRVIGGKWEPKKVKVLPSYLP